MTFEQINESLDKGKYSPLYLFHGEESYFIDTLLEKIQDTILNDIEKEFNQNVFYGKDADPKNIIGSCMQYPMMSEYRIVILKEAQNLKELDLLLPIVQNPVETTIFVVTYKDGKVNMTTKFGRAFKSNGVVFDSAKLYENKVPEWIIKHSKSIGLKVTQNAAILLTALLSTDLSKINNELQKLKLFFGENDNIDVEQVKNHTGLNREYSVFELNKAIGERDRAKTFNILNLFSQNPTAYPNTMVISTIFGYFTKILICSENIKLSDPELSKLIGISPFFVKEYRHAAKVYSREKLLDSISILAEYDVKSKGVESRSFSQIDLLIEMTLKIMS